MWLNELYKRLMGRTSRRTRRRLSRQRTFIRPRLERLEDRTLLSPVVATTTSQLIGDIVAANNGTGPTTIQLQAADSTNGFDFTSAYNSTLNALPQITANITIEGTSGYTNTIQRSTATGTPAFRLFDVASSGNLTLQNVKLTGGYAFGTGNAAEGGAIFSSGKLNLSSVTVKSNAARGNAGGGAGGNGGNALGGGVYQVGGGLTLATVVLAFNEALGGNGGGGSASAAGGAGGGAYGGGLAVSSASATLSNVTLDNNQAIGGNGGNGGNGSNGASGSLFKNGGNGFLGGLGGTGGNGAGGGLFVAGGSVTMTNHSSLSTNDAKGGSGGNGGNGGNGGIASGAFTNGYGGHGGAGGTGGLAVGGGLYMAEGGSVTITNGFLDKNEALGGNGGQGGQGGFGRVTRNNGRTRASAGGGGAAGNGMGGGLFANPFNETLTITLTNDTLDGNQAQGGTGGTGGNNAKGNNPGGGGGVGGTGTGGGLEVLGNTAAATLTNDILSSNQALGGNGGNGGTYSGGTRNSRTSRYGAVGSGGNAYGGGVYVTGGNLTLTYDSFNENKAVGATGVAGAKGSRGIESIHDHLSEGKPGDNGGSGGDAQGGALYAGGTVSVTGGFNSFLLNQAQGGNGGNGGNGGIGSAEGTTVGAGGAGGAGGIGGNAAGGGLYVLTKGNFVNKDDALSSNEALGGDGGAGGTGGAGSTGTDLNFNSSNGGAGGAGGAAGNATGGGMFMQAGQANQSNSTLDLNKAVGGNGGKGGIGGKGGKATSPAFNGGNGGDGGARGSGGNATGGGLYDASLDGTLINDTLSGNISQGGGGATGGTGGQGGTPTSGNAGHAGGNGGGGNGGSAQGGGLYVTTAGVLLNDTLSSNQALGGNGGNVYASFPSDSGGSAQGGGLYVVNGYSIEFINNLVAENVINGGSGGGLSPITGAASGPDVSGYFYNGENDLIGNSSGYGAANESGDILDTASAGLDPSGLQNNGGPLVGAPSSQQVLQTIALVAGSPAIDAGITSFPGPSVPSTDERSYGRIGGVDIGAFQFDGVPPTSTSLSSSSNPSVSGQNVTLTAVVTNPSNAPATGTVDFKGAGGNVLGTGTLSVINGVDEATFTTSTLPVGSDTINAFYLGNTGFTKSDTTAAPLIQQVNPVTTANLQTTLKTATQAAFQENNNTDAQTLLNAIDSLSSPTNPVTVTMDLGSGNYTNLVANPPAGVTLIINGVSGSTTIVGNGNSPALTVLSGDVEIENGITFTTSTNAPTILVEGGSLTLNGDTIDSSTGYNQAALAVTSGGLTLGTNNTLNISASGQFLQATSFTGITQQAPMVLEQNGSPINGTYLSLTSVSSSESTSVYGQSIALTATVSTVDGGAPTGSVDFFDTTTGQDLGSASVVAANGSYQAVLNTSAVAVGTNSILATYGSDGTYGFSSANTNQVVSTASTTTTITSTKVSSTYNSIAATSVTLSATVAGATAATVNEGNVTFVVSNPNGGVLTATGAVSNGTATATLILPTGLAAGSYPLSFTANYADSSNANEEFDYVSSSTSTTGTLTVNAASTQTNLLTTSVSSTYNSTTPQSVVLSAAVASSNGGTVNEGAVTFTVGTLTATGTVSGGFATATLTLPAGLASGSYLIHASFADATNANGVVNYNSSTATAGTLTVQTANSSLTVTDTNSPITYNSGSETLDLKANVTSSNGGTVSEGDVVFTVNGVSSGPIAVTGGTASTTLTIPTGFATGNYVLTASYADQVNADGSLNYAASGGSSTLSVVSAATTTRLSQILIFPQGNFAVELLTAIVTSPGGPVTGGFVSFDIDGLMFNAPVQNGQATAMAILPLSLASMPQNIRVLFTPPDANFAASTEAASAFLSMLDEQDFSFVLFNSDGSQTVETVINGVPIGLVFNAQGQFTGFAFGIFPSLP